MGDLGRVGFGVAWGYGMRVSTAGILGRVDRLCLIL